LLRLGGDETSVKKELGEGKINKSEAEARYSREFDQEKANTNYKAMGKAGLFVPHLSAADSSLTWMKPITAKIPFFNI
jgi:hypothetical protein